MASFERAKLNAKAMASDPEKPAIKHFTLTRKPWDKKGEDRGIYFNPATGEEIPFPDHKPPLYSDFNKEDWIITNV